MKNTYQTSLLLIMLTCAGSFIILLSSKNFPEPQINYPITQKVEKKIEKTIDNLSELTVAKITWFGNECNTTWCKEHKELPRKRVVAVNVAKYGYPKQVYIPKWDAIYDVIEKPYTNTDGKTDIDVWCLNDTKCQQQVESARTLAVKMIY